MKTAEKRPEGGFRCYENAQVSAGSRALHVFALVFDTFYRTAVDFCRAADLHCALARTHLRVQIRIVALLDVRA